jgi:hypothetical protein
MPLRLQPLPPARPFRATPRPKDTFNRFRGSTVPSSGWTQQSFQTREGKKLIKDVLAVRRLALRENSKRLTKALKAMFEDEASLVLGEFASRLAKHHKLGKSIGSNLVNVVLTLNVPDGSERMWEEALDAVFAEDPTKGRILKVFKPTYQSVMDHVIRKTGVLIPPRYVGGRPSGDLIPVTSVSTAPMTIAQQAKLVPARADKLCEKVTQISETTKKRMRKFFQEKIESGATMGDIVREMRKAFPQIAANRIPTIVRNELSIAANEAQIISFQNSLSITHCSVVGCQSVDDSPHQYHGFHTCNIRNVPVQDLQLVEFHINHTGSWVPTGFRNSDGSIPRLPLGNSPGIGHHDDPNALRHRDPAAAGLGTVARLNRH